MNRSDFQQRVDSNFSCSFAKLASDDWHRILDSFEDASIFQTTPFCTERKGRNTCEHVVVNRGSQVVSAVQVRVMSIPFSGAAIAYVISGPLFHRRESDRDWEALRQTLRALRSEYVVRRAIGLRVNTLLSRDFENECVPVFESEGYTYAKQIEAKRTMIVDLTPPLPELRKGLEQKWRNQLNRAEKNNLQILEGSDDEQFELFLQIYRQMITRKRLAEPGDIRTFRAMQSVLPERFKMKVIAILEKGEPCAAAIFSAIGRRGIYLFGATAELGMKNKASYLAQWRAVQWFKEMRCTEYDLHGVNAAANPGVYTFKSGLCGKNGKEVEIMGQFEAHRGLRGKLVLSAAEFANRVYRNLKNTYGKYRGFQG